jgi:hypothetical protein
VLRRARCAVGALFFVNGALFANWVPRIPDVKSALALSEGALGLAILGGARHGGDHASGLRRVVLPGATGADTDASPGERARRRGLVLPTGAVGALGLMALLGALVDDAPGSWSAVYLRETLGASAGVAGLGGLHGGDDGRTVGAGPR